MHFCIIYIHYINLYILSKLVRRGGWLMEYYLWSCSSWSVLKMYKEWLLVNDDVFADDGDSEALFDKILSACIQPFVGWLIRY